MKIVWRAYFNRIYIITLNKLLIIRKPISLSSASLSPVDESAFSSISQIAVIFQSVTLRSSGICLPFAIPPTPILPIRFIKLHLLIYIFMLSQRIIHARKLVFHFFNCFIMSQSRFCYFQRLCPMNCIF